MIWPSVAIMGIQPVSRMLPDNPPGCNTTAVSFCRLSKFMFEEIQSRTATRVLGIIVRHRPKGLHWRIDFTHYKRPRPIPEAATGESEWRTSLPQKVPLSRQIPLTRIRPGLLTHDATKYHPHHSRRAERRVRGDAGRFLFRSSRIL